MEKKTNKKGLIAGVIGLAALVLVFAGIAFAFREKPVEGSKSITIEVVNQSSESVNYQIKTEAEFLRQAMEEAESKGLTFSGTESEYGMMIDTINGVRADYSLDNAYWSFYINGDYCNYGIDEQPVTDGDKFSIVYTPAQ